MSVSKSMEMAKSGKERLCYEVCRACLLWKEKKRLHERTLPPHSELPWTKWDDERFGEWFVSEWESEGIDCPGEATWTSVWKDPPKHCPHKFRHQVGLTYHRWRGNDETEG